SSTTCSSAGSWAGGPGRPSNSGARTFPTTTPFSGGASSCRPRRPSRPPPRRPSTAPRPGRTGPISPSPSPFFRERRAPPTAARGPIPSRPLPRLVALSLLAPGLRPQRDVRVPLGRRAGGGGQAAHPLGVPPALLLDAPASRRRHGPHSSAHVLRRVSVPPTGDAGAHRPLPRRARRSLALGTLTACGGPAPDQPRRDCVQRHLVDALQLLQRLRVGHGVPLAPVPGHREHLPRQGSCPSQHPRAGLLLPHH